MEDVEKQRGESDSLQVKEEKRRNYSGELACFLLFQTNPDFIGDKVHWKFTSVAKGTHSRALK